MFYKDILQINLPPEGWQVKGNLIYFCLFVFVGKNLFVIKSLRSGNNYGKHPDINQTENVSVTHVHTFNFAKNKAIKQ